MCVIGFHCPHASCCAGSQKSGKSRYGKCVLLASTVPMHHAAQGRKRGASRCGRSGPASACGALTARTRKASLPWCSPRMVRRWAGTS
eukprot:scaffold179916_cov23-Tisochrysis_lutea.AAC.1